ncbi:MAG TPA: DUF494 family protein [Halanaerobiales bacterium]|nr:DUF494 family protein [Halanaerobiales bacterium]
MNENIIEIISLLVHKLINEEDMVFEDELIEELLDMGYDIKDIDEAFELIYNGTEIIGEENYYVNDLKGLPFYNRVFTVSERLYLPIEIRGMLLKLISSNYLSFEECEEVIIRVIQDNFEGQITALGLWYILEQVVDETGILEKITSSISEFKDIIPGDSKFIN